MMMSTVRNRLRLNAMLTSPVFPPRASVVLGDGDVVIQLSGDESTSFREIVQAMHTEASYFADECVFVDEADRVDQHIHHDSQEGDW